ncbi:YaaC family protein [Yersinia alsatica]|uniref:YaaC family protein n=1 Tax=Yersinia alsatica TaxID=2890317 RepID=UPI0011A2700B|nr:YaaC family protein [Yersinia alsatica]
MDSFTPILINNRVMKPHKASLYPDLNSRNVLTYSHWDFVELWLKRNNKEDALFYWNQARVFNQASSGLSNQSSPLLHYYSFMNAAKALLSSRDIIFNQHHGVTAAKNDNYTNEGLETTGIFIKGSGIVPSLATYIKDEDERKQYSLYDLFYNLPYIHRTYCLTYNIQEDMFIPIKDAHFIYDASSEHAYFIATLSKDFSYDGIGELLPNCFQLISDDDNNEYKIRSTYSINYISQTPPSANELDMLTSLHNKIRRNLYYINGAETLWYIKSTINQDRQILRSPTTITLAAMHRLSELSRYDPFKLNSFLSGRENWLLAEFIQQSPSQFIDEISSEITGHQFLIPNVRAAK